MHGSGEGKALQTKQWDKAKPTFQNGHVITSEVRSYGIVEGEGTP